MEAEIMALAGTAGTAFVTLLATDAWNTVRDGVVDMWRRARPERAADISAELDSTREELIRARTEGDQETEADLRGEWRGRVRRLLAEHPEVAEELRGLLARLEPAAPHPPTVTQQATASDRARVYQAGRDLHLGQQ
ncbi:MULTISPECIES: hypothetical protein [unclassified Streptomyces]|uniref:hypothetical protein n=1 Tax=unclassified Streptomyces TaxID=2593676 RepID=UPI003805FD70